MMIELFLAIWVLVGLWSFVITQNIINGWDYVKSQPNPHKLFISAMLMGFITPLICCYTLYKFYKTKKEVNNGSKIL